MYVLLPLACPSNACTVQLQRHLHLLAITWAHRMVVHRRQCERVPTQLCPPSSPAPQSTMTEEPLDVLHAATPRRQAEHPSLPPSSCKRPRHALAPAMLSPPASDSTPRLHALATNAHTCHAGVAPNLTAGHARARAITRSTKRHSCIARHPAPRTPLEPAANVSPTGCVPCLTHDMVANRPP